MSDEEIETLATYLADLGPSDMRDGAYEVNLTKSELEYILESIELNYGK